MECGGGCQIYICNLNLQLCRRRRVNIKCSSEMANFTREAVEAAILSSCTTIHTRNRIGNLSRERIRAIR